MTQGTDTTRVELMMVQYANGERRVVEARDCEEDVPGRMYFHDDKWMHPGCASQFLTFEDLGGELLDYSLDYDMSEEEMAQVRDLDGVTIIRREQFHGR